MLVVSPIISLMKDQVRTIWEKTGCSVEEADAINCFAGNGSYCGIVRNTRFCVVGKRSL